MQLSPGERSILAYFPTSNAARAAAEELKRAGFEHVQVDRISRFGQNHDAELNNPLMGRAETITGLTLYSTGTSNMLDNDNRVLKAADPSVSGYGNHNYGIAGGKAFLVTLVTNDASFAKAEAIIKENGGTL